MKAEQFIKDCTKSCSNELESGEWYHCQLYHEWLTPAQALRAVEIAKEELLNNIVKYIHETIDEPKYFECCLEDYSTSKWLQEAMDRFVKSYNHIIEEKKNE